MSNKAALSLYRDQLGYTCDRTISHYYRDNEDAHMMLLSGLQEQLQQLPAHQRDAIKKANTDGLRAADADALLNKSESEIASPAQDVSTYSTSQSDRSTSR